MIDPITHLKGFLLRWTCPLFFKRIGRRCTFDGRIRLPLPRRNIIIGDDCMIGEAVYFRTSWTSEIVVGNNSSINTGCHLVANERITIGDNVAIAEYVSIRDQEHRFSTETGVRGQGYNVAPVTIGDNVWIGRGVYIGPGTTISRGSIVGANSVVRGSFPPNVLIVGAPAVIKKILTASDIRSDALAHGA
jgi:acetyltransferase-like isoleucine patch superfamily enzyme